MIINTISANSKIRFESHFRSRNNDAFFYSKESNTFFFLTNGNHYIRENRENRHNHSRSLSSRSNDTHLAKNQEQFHHSNLNV